VRKVRAWLLRFGGLFNKRRRDVELTAELESHLQLHIEDNLRAGMTPDEAWRAALIKLGGVEQTKEIYRDRKGLPMIETFLQDLSFGFRMMRKSPGFTAAAVLALALGIGANTAIFSVVNVVLLHSLPYRDAGRLMWVTTFLPRQGQNIVVHPDYLGWRQQNHVFEDIAAYSPGFDYTLTGAGEAVRLSGARVTKSFFHVLGVAPRIGREFSAEEDRPKGPHAAILTDALWKQRFDRDAGVVGRVIALDGNAYTVVGVMPPDFEFPENSRAQVLVPFALSEGAVIVLNEPLFMVRVIGRLRPKITPAAAAVELDAIDAHLHASYPGGYAKMMAGAQARVVSLHDHQVGNVRQALIVLLGAVTFVLLIACANVANLQLARAVSREKEIAMRGALGAGRGRITRQLLTESGLIAMFGGAVGALLALWALRIVRALGPKNTPHLASARLDWRVLLFALGVSLASGMLFGLAPTLAALRVPLNQPLREASMQGGASGGARRSQKILMAAEVALALVLFIGAGLLTRSLVRLISIPPGFDGAGVLTAQITLPLNFYKEPEQQRAFFSELVQRVQSLPGVTAAGATQTVPLRGFVYSSVLAIEGRPVPTPSEQLAFGVAADSVTPDYCSVLHIPLIAGRLVDDRDAANAPRAAMVNQTLVRTFFPHEDPIGKRVKLASEDWMTIVGVIQDTKQTGLAAEVEPEIFLSMQQTPSDEMTLVIRSSVASAVLVPALRAQVAALDRNLPVYGVQTMDELLAGEVASQRFNSYLLGAFAVLAVLLAAVGIYGVMAYAVSQRTREIGIRLALGAEAGDVRGMVLFQGLWMAVAGIVTGLAASFALTRLMRTLLYGVKPTDPATFTVVSIVLLFVALAACWIPARRATRVDPMVALRHE
jgi:predicted permease